MQIDLERVKHHPIHVEGVVELPRVADENPQVQRIEPVSVQVDVDIKEEQYSLRGSVKATVEYVCSRCLEPYSARLETEFEESVAETEAATVPGESVAGRPTKFLWLDPYVEEAVNLALEYRPLCREDCRGLCVECGCNLNEHQCHCDTRRVDPRLAVLADLLSKDDSE
ncbi:MAG: DUF177 domain-containing protein [Alicyclobacillus herbarius]|uniref:YceD family protein n=1 Tax=Alicyclobacillus herbarius TaxID=122960 RepID=UPI0023559B1A|nr:DUF177 domain-containing protein [Alicyclobacillus herbarius]MCL6632132.1 DUF177 domain-containing protein [Alicyclobacillus herbarius]